MGRHKEWRKIAKKERRRRIRTLIAQKKDNIHLSLPKEEYDQWLEAQNSLEIFEISQIEESNKIENQKWMQAELIEIEKWKKLQEKKELLHRKELEIQAKLNLELEMEKKRQEMEIQRLKEIEEEIKRRQEKFQNNLELFLNGDAEDPPPELLVLHETKPTCDQCPFFIKTACCRFGDDCSRNHRYPGISKVLLATNLFTHFGLENTTINEYDTDIMLEFEDSDTYRDFKDFFYDVLPEFQKFGEITQFKSDKITRVLKYYATYYWCVNNVAVKKFTAQSKVCNNYERHLRGNTYVEFAEVRCAVAAYRALHGRWYAGRQLSLQFCDIASWKTAICGLQSRQRCPKGRSCNFLHVFRNPGRYHRDEYRERDRNTHSTRSWRWSASPERDPSPPRRRNARERRRSRERRHSRSSSSRKHKR